MGHARIGLAATLIFSCAGGARDLCIEVCEEAQKECPGPAPSADCEAACASKVASIEAARCDPEAESTHECIVDDGTICLGPPQASFLPGVAANDEFMVGIPEACRAEADNFRLCMCVVPPTDEWASLCQ